MNEQMMRSPIDDMGVAAYLRMHGFKIVGKKGRNYYFEYPIREENEFKRCTFEYVNSPYHDFDSHLMAIKKLKEYLPE